MDTINLGKSQVSAITKAYKNGKSVALSLPPKKPITSGKLTLTPTQRLSVTRSDGKPTKVIITHGQMKEGGFAFLLPFLEPLAVAAASALAGEVGKFVGEKITGKGVSKPAAKKTMKKVTV